MTRIIIAGCRDFSDYELLKRTCNEYFSTIEDNDILIISGGAKGADKLGEKYAYENHYFVKKFFPKWETHGRAAGPMRNREMAEYAAMPDGVGHLIAFWDGKSRGTKSMIQLAKENGLKVKVIRYD